MGKAVRPVRIVGDLAYVPLTKGCEAVIDAADALLVGQWNWVAQVRRPATYALRTSARNIDGKQHTIFLHRLILGFPNVRVDHRDCDGLNNRRENLRLATASQNLCNQRPSCRNTSGHKGVNWDAQKGKWRAVITFHRKRKFLGHFDSKEIAAAEYAKANAAIHGEFGRVG